MIECSIAMATYNQARWLRRTFETIFIQKPSFEYEVVVADDGSTDDTPKVCTEFPVRYTRIERPSKEYRSPSVARNVAFKLCRGKTIINQSSDVEHGNPYMIEQLVKRLTPTTCTIARVLNVAEDGTILGDHFGYRPHRLVFFLGALWREDIYKLGGQDEDFIGPGYEDTWFRFCLQRIGRKANFCQDLIGYHHDHPKPEYSYTNRRLMFRKLRQARRGLHPWGARTGSWTFDYPS